MRARKAMSLSGSFKVIKLMTPDCKAGVIFMIPTPQAVLDVKMCRCLSGVQLVPVGTRMGRISPAVIYAAFGTYMWHSFLDRDHLVTQSYRICHIVSAERERINTDEAFLRVVTNGASYEKMCARKSEVLEGLDGAEGAVKRIWAEYNRFVIGTLFRPPRKGSKEMFSAFIGLLSINDAKVDKH
jgi:hypothetical protein